MAAGSEVKESARHRARGWLQGLGFRQMWQLALAGGLAATALFGGLDSVDTKMTPMKAGGPFDDGQFTITIERAVGLDEMPPPSALGTMPSPGKRYLAVVATIRNDGTVDGTLAGLDKEVELRDQPDQEFLGAVRMSDGSPIVRLGPGLTESVAFIWQLPQSALEPGSTVTLRVWRKEYRELAVTYGQAWITTDEYGEMQLPVKVKS